VMMLVGGGGLVSGTSASVSCVLCEPTCNPRGVCVGRVAGGCLGVITTDRDNLGEPEPSILCPLSSLLCLQPTPWKREKLNDSPRKRDNQPPHKGSKDVGGGSPRIVVFFHFFLDRPIVLLFHFCS
jgi:hypothetical protein